jgi:phage baseplate assembly protein W
MMIGMSRTTGKPLSGDAHLAQSIADILTTPIGTRVMRRDYGSLIPELLDAPLNGATAIRLYAATAQALRRWEPRLDLVKVRVTGGADGRATIAIDGRRGDAPAPNSFFTLTIPLRPAA